MKWAETDLLVTWKALKEGHSNAEWRLGMIASSSQISFEAGVKFPEQTEAVVLSLPSNSIGSSSTLPTCRGFELIRFLHDRNAPDTTSIALTRKPEGNIALFEVVVVDILRHMEHLSHNKPELIWQHFLSRIIQWQRFSEQTADKPLSERRQTGLFGELTALEMLCESTLGATAAITTWVGPQSAAQDFHLNGGAIETKSTLKLPFIAKVSSVEQLDSSDKHPLLLIAYHFVQDGNGRSLPDLVSKLRATARQSGVGLQLDALLLLSGYRDEHLGSYGKKLSAANCLCFEVDNEFPCLRRSKIPMQVTKATYSLSLDVLADTTRLSTEEALSMFAIGKSQS